MGDLCSLFVPKLAPRLRNPPAKTAFPPGGCLKFVSKRLPKPTKAYFFGGLPVATGRFSLRSVDKPNPGAVDNGDKSLGMLL